jgi:hypothetical protein
MSEFSEWFRKEYLDWEKENTGNIQGLTKFSEYLGVPQSMASAWMNERYKPGAKYIPSLAQKLGFEVYSVLGLPSPETSALLDSLPPGVQSKLVAALTEAQQMASESGINLDSPKGSDIVNSVLRKHGL